LDKFKLSLEQIVKCGAHYSAHKRIPSPCSCTPWKAQLTLGLFCGSNASSFYWSKLSETV